MPQNAEICASGKTLLQVCLQILEYMAMQILQVWPPNTRIHGNVDPTSVASKYQIIHSNADPTSVASKYQIKWQYRSYKCGLQIPEYMAMQILQVWPPNTRIHGNVDSTSVASKYQIIHSNADPTSVATKYQNTWQCRSYKCGNQIPEYMAMQILQVWQPNTRIHGNADPTSVASKYQNT